MTRSRIALIGDPVAHSVSPAVHGAAFAAAGLPLTYEAVRVSREDLPTALPRLRRAFLGLNVTRPLKEAILPLLDEVSAEAARAGSVNTVRFHEGIGEGHSTDGRGFLAALGAAGGAPPRRAVVLGTGGAARAVTAALVEAETSVTVAGRNARAGRRLAADLGGASGTGGRSRAVRFVTIGPGPLARALAEADLLVNATPVGSDPRSRESPLPEGVPLPPTVFDLVYRPRRTALLASAEAAGSRVVEGVEMLVEQAARSFEVWTGLPASADAMRAAAYRALEEDPAPASPSAGAAGPR